MPAPERCEYCGCDDVREYQKYYICRKCAKLLSEVK